MIVKARKDAQIVDRIAHLMIENIEYDFVSISMSAFDISIIYHLLLGRKCARFFIGTDVLKCKLFWHYRWRVKLCSLFCDNLTVVEWLTDELNELNIKARTINHYAHFGILSTYNQK